MVDPPCTVIVLNYNGRNLLLSFLPSILKMTYDNFKVVVVDNASHDDSLKILTEHFPTVEVVRSTENLGTAGGSNLGARYSKGEYILWLSNDMEVEPRLLELMIARAEGSPDIGICTCKMRRLDSGNRHTSIIDSVGGDIDNFGFPTARGIDQIDQGQFDEPSDVFFSFGGAMLIKREVLEKTGGFDPSFFTLVDDIDLSWRTRLAGYRIVVEPSAVLYHKVSATLGSFHRSNRRYLAERNTLRMLMKNYGSRSLVKYLPGYFALFMAENALYAALGKHRIIRGETMALIWNLKNLSDTICRRSRVQSMRLANDSVVQLAMRRHPAKVAMFKEYLAGSREDAWTRYFG